MGLVEIYFTVVIPVGLVIMMAGLGLSLTLADLTRVFIFPKAVVIGLSGQLLLLPLIAFVLAILIAPTPAVAVGAIILAACPGGVTSNGFVFGSRGDLALSITLTAISSIITVLTIPVFTAVGLYYFYTNEMSTPDVPVMQMIMRLSLLTVLPVTVGMIVRAKWPEFSIRLVEPMRKFALSFLFVLIFTSILLSMDTIIENMFDAGIIAFGLNITSMSAGYLLSRLFRLTTEQTISITYEIGLQNLALALTVVLSLLKSPELAATALVYIVFMNVTAFGFHAIARRMLKKR